MKSFLITFKPAAENPERGWPLEELQKLVKRNRAGEHPVEHWRFNNRKDVSIGDRVFLLLQGKGGPAIIGYGKVVGEPNSIARKREVAVQFESVTDPTTDVLATREDLLAVESAQRFWRIQSSGVQLPEAIAAVLEVMVVGNSPKPKGEESASNPDWTRDELILALDFYLKYRPNPPGKDSQEIAELSKALNRLGEKLFPPEERAHTFRNENGVYMKLMNFRRLDPQYTALGKTGLSRGAQAEEEVWAEFAGDLLRCRCVAQAVMASLDDPEFGTIPDIDSGIQEAAEGRLLTRKHLVRERDPRLVASKRRQVMNEFGRLICEVCDFDFEVRYGDHGKGFIECHHIKPVHTLAAGDRTSVDDLALVCANCHRMIHRRRQWLTLDQLRTQLQPRHG